MYGIEEKGIRGAESLLPLLEAEDRYRVCGHFLRIAAEKIWLQDC